VRIEIKNWEKYNERKDRKSHFWFRFQNDFFVSNTLFGIEPNDRIVFIYLLCEQSKSDNIGFDLNIQRACILTKIKESEFNKSIKVLESIGVICARKRADARKSVSYSTEQTVHTEQNNTEHEQHVLTDKSRTQRIKTIFLKSYEKHLGRKYASWQPKHTAMLTNWLKGISENEAARLIELYPQWNDSWVTKQGHPIEVFFKQANQVNAWFSNPQNHIQKLAAGKHQEEQIKKEISKESGVYEFREQIQRNRNDNDGIRSQIPNENKRIVSQTIIARDDRQEFNEHADESDFGESTSEF